MKLTRQKKMFVCIIAGMTFSINTHAQIVYTNIPDTIISGIKTFYIDLNNDGVNDFKFITEKPLSSCKACGGLTYMPSFSVSMTPLNSNKVLDTANYPKILMNNALIKASSSAWKTGTRLMFTWRYVCSTSCYNADQGIWNNQSDKYIGVKLLKNGIKYFGWIRVSVAFTSITIKDFAFDSTPNHSIHAGATSGARTIKPAVNIFSSVKPSPVFQTIKTDANGLSLLNESEKTKKIKRENEFNEAKKRLPMNYKNTPENTIETNSIQIYPNPASNTFTISLPFSDKKVEITITDNTGKQIYKTTIKEIQNIEVDTKEYSAGTYLVKIQTEIFSETRKLIITK